MASYRLPMFSQDTDGSMAGFCSTPTTSILKDVTNTSFPCLWMPKETMTDTLHPHVKAVWLQLSLSQTQTTANEKPGYLSRLDHEVSRNVKPYCDKASTCNLDSQLQISVRDDAALTRGMTNSNQAIPPAGPTELSLPVAQQSSPTRGNNILPADKIHSEEKLGDNLSISDKKRLKSKKTIISDEYVQAAIELTVATAETLVIADTLNGCQMCKDLGPKAILDAAFILKRERDASGLNDFSLEDKQGLGFPDSKWEEDLEEDVLETELYGVPLLESMEQGPTKNICKLADVQSVVEKDLAERANVSATQTVTSMDEGLCKNTFWLADVQSNLCPPVATEAALEATRSKTAELSEAHNENYSGDGNEMIQGTITKRLPAIRASRDEDHTSFKSFQSQVVTSKDLFNSRWFGGWTAVNFPDGEQAWHKARPLEKIHRCCMKFETSELSETSYLSSQAINVLQNVKDFQANDPKCANTLVSRSDPEALSAGSCAEILLALSQASVKCTSQEPLCSFVPCSINVKVNPPITGQPGSSCAEFTEKITRQNTSYVANIIVSGNEKESCMGAYDRLQNSPLRCTKRTYLGSLKNHSTISSVHQGTLHAEENHFLKLSKDERLKQNENESLKCCKAAELLFHGNKLPQCELIFEDSALQDSPPLVWHRGKRRRLRACQTIESDFIQGIFSEPANCSSPTMDGAMGNLPGPKNIKIYNKPRAQRDKNQPLSSDKQFIIEHYSLNKDPRVLKEQPCKMSPRGNNRSRVLKRATGKQSMYKSMERRASNNQIFRGICFLVTGFAASQKNTMEELCKKIQNHSGVIMSSIPNSSSINGAKIRLRHRPINSNTIVIAPQKVRTLKYLYGCAAGLLLVRPNWVDEMISRNVLVLGENHKKKATTGQLRASICCDREATKDLIFARVSAYIHGRRNYCLKLSMLIQHGAGKVFRNIKRLVEENNGEMALTRVIVAEHQSRLPNSVKETAAKFGLRILPGNWIIDSLFDGKLLPMPGAAKDASKSEKVLANSKTGIPRENLSKNQNIGRNHFPLPPEHMLNVDMLPPEGDNLMKSSISFLGEGREFPQLSDAGLSFVLDIPKASVTKELPEKVYYKSVSMEGQVYSAGDIIEVRPSTNEINKPHVAQIESFYAGHLNDGLINSAKSESRQESEPPVFLCCRWFYRPSDTGFSFGNDDKELYLSQQFDQNAPIQSLIRKVQMALVMSDMAFVNSAESSWRRVSQSSCAVEAADYVCRFFYDCQKESLHRLGAALTSSLNSEI